METTKRKQQGGWPRRTTCKDCGTYIDNSDMTKKSFPRCKKCQLSFIRESKRRRRMLGPTKEVDWRETRRTTCKTCGVPIDNSDLSKPAYTECTPCKSARVVDARRSRVFGERELGIDEMNEELKATGQRICSKCFGKKSLKEFSNTAGKRGTSGGRVHKLCDECLDKYFSGNKRPDSFTHNYLRQRAYSINSRATQKLSMLIDTVDPKIDDLPSVIKPQDLTQMLESVGYRCVYCGETLTTEVTTFDHRTPLSSADNLERFAELIKPSNIAPCCKNCNQLKHTKTEHEFSTFKVEYAKRILALEQQDKEPAG